MIRKAALMVASALALLTPHVPASAVNSQLGQIYGAGRCIVDHDRSAAISLMRSLPLGRDDADLSSLSPDLARRCSPGNNVLAIHLRGALAQALFFRDFGSFGVEPARAVPLVNLDIPMQDSPAGDATTELYRLSDCVVRNDAGHVEQLLSSRPDSGNETRFMELLAPYLRACAPASAQLSLTRSDLRSALAQSAYQSMYRYWTRQLTPIRDQ
jgi:hypothetical protein